MFPIFFKKMSLNILKKKRIPFDVPATKTYPEGEKEIAVNSSSAVMCELILLF